MRPHSNSSSLYVHLRRHIRNFGKPEVTDDLADDPDFEQIKAAINRSISQADRSPRADLIGGTRVVA